MGVKYEPHEGTTQEILSLRNQLHTTNIMCTKWDHRKERKKYIMKEFKILPIFCIRQTLCAQTAITEKKERNKYHERT